MKVDLFNINDFIKVNNVKEVINPITFENGSYPTEDGLLSYSIFGLPGSYDRKTIFGYIDLKKHFLHPLIYKMLVNMNRKFKKIIDGTGYFKINDKGELEEDNENGNTGIEWLYENFSKLKFENTDSIKRKNKVSLLESLDINEIFIDKYLIIPAFYRDVDTSKNGRVSVDELNRMYTALISLCLSSNDEFDFMGHLTECKIQLKLVEIYEYLIHFVEKKQGLIKNGLLGKTVDYSVRSVISAGRINVNTPKEQIVKFTYVGVPLAHLCNLFFPFFVYEIQRWAEEAFATVQEVPVLYKGKKTYFEVINPLENFTATKIEAMLNLFIKSPENRLDNLYIKTKGPDNKITEGILNFYKDELYRDFTLLDLIFIVAHKVCSDKHVYVTRFPVENYQSIYPARIKIMSTYKTKNLTVNNTFFEDYPVITSDIDYPDSSNKKEMHYVDTVILHNSCLESLGADFDGKKYKIL